MAERGELPISAKAPHATLELALIFLRLGTTAFGGPAAHIALMEQEFVRRRGWLTHEEFLDMIGAANLVPGPSSTEVAIHIGLRRAGWVGLVLAGVCFILPAALLVSGFAWAYVRFGSLPSFQAALYGIKPVVVAVVAQAIWNLGRKAIDTWLKRGLIVLCGVLAWLGVSALPVLLGSGVVAGLMAVRKDHKLRSVLPLLQLLATIAFLALLPVAWESLRHGRPSPDALSVFLYFLKLGSVMYGSGYVLLAFLERDLVTGWRWLTKGQLLDAVAVGQFTPGPVFTTATFIGYILAGPFGAVCATVGIFIPAFIFVAVSGKVLPKLRLSPVSSGFLDGVNAAALALMAVVLVKLGMDAVQDLAAATILVVAAVALIRFRLNSALLIAAGGLVGVILSLVR
jgi:chromate transporter